MNWYQHGDVKIIPVSTVPKGLKKLKHNVLMDGELTGHAHRVESGKFQLAEKDGTLYFCAETECTVKHEEHKPITIPEGNYEIGKVREFDFFEREIRAVQD